MKWGVIGPLFSRYRRAGKEMGKLGDSLPAIESSSPVRELYIGGKSAGKMIAFIRGNLYSDKWGSFIREVISNAYDANRVSRYSGPVEIVLPSVISSELLIIDRGPGMGYRFMEEDYTNVGFSTKEESLDEVGAFGIGRLTPLLVCDQYKIETVHKGVRYIWTMAIGARDGLIPEYQEETDRPSGTTIRVPCEVRDIPKIEEALQRWCCFMEPLPLVNGKPLNVGGRGNYIEGRDWMVSRPGKTAITVLNGWVPYPVVEKHIPREWTDLGHLVIRLPIGAVSLTASREALEYTEGTLDVINGKVKEIVTELIVRANKEIGGAQTLREALKRYKSYPYRVQKDALWRGYRLNKIEVKVRDVDASKFQIGKGGNLSQRNTEDWRNLAFEPEVFINDIERNYRPRLKQYMLGRGFSYRNDEEVYLLPKEALEIPLVKEMDWPPLSSLPDIPKAPKIKLNPANPKQEIKTNKKQVKVYEWKAAYSIRTAPNLLKYTEEVALPTDAPGGVYLLVKNGAIVKGFHQAIPDSTTIANLMKCLPNRKLYLIPEASFPLLIGEWKLLDEVIKEHLGDKIEFYLELYCNRKCLPVKANLRGNILTSSQGILTLPANELLKANLEIGGAMRRYLEEGFKNVEWLEVYEAQAYAAMVMSLQKGRKTKLIGLFEGVNKTYPLIQKLRTMGVLLDSPGNIPDIIQYVKGIDLLNKQESKS